MKRNTRPGQSLDQDIPSTKSKLLESIKKYNDDVAQLKAKEELLMSMINMLEGLIPPATTWYMWKYAVASINKPEERPRIEQEVKQKLSRMLKAVEDLKKEVEKVKSEQKEYSKLDPDIKPGSHDLIGNAAIDDDDDEIGAAPAPLEPIMSEPSDHLGVSNTSSKDGEDSPQPSPTTLSDGSARSRPQSRSGMTLALKYDSHSPSRVSKGGSSTTMSKYSSRASKDGSLTPMSKDPSRVSKGGSPTPMSKDPSRVSKSGSPTPVSEVSKDPSRVSKGGSPTPVSKDPSRVSKGGSPTPMSKDPSRVSKGGSPTPMSKDPSRVSKGGSPTPMSKDPSRVSKGGSHTPTSKDPSRYSKDGSPTSMSEAPSRVSKDGSSSLIEQDQGSVAPRMLRVPLKKAVRHPVEMESSQDEPEDGDGREPKPFKDKKPNMAEGSKSKSRIVREVIEIERDGEPTEEIVVQPGMEPDQLKMVEDLLRRMDMERDNLRDEMDRIFGPLPEVLMKTADIPKSRRGSPDRAEGKPPSRGDRPKSGKDEKRPPSRGESFGSDESPPPERPKSRKKGKSGKDEKRPPSRGESFGSDESPPPERPKSRKKDKSGKDEKRPPSRGESFGSDESPPPERPKSRKKGDRGRSPKDDVEIIHPKKKKNKKSPEIELSGVGSPIGLHDRPRSPQGTRGPPDPMEPPPGVAPFGQGPPPGLEDPFGPPPGVMPPPQPAPADENEIAQKVDQILDRLNKIQIELEKRKMADQKQSINSIEESDESVEDFAQQLNALQAKINQGIDRLENAISRHMVEQEQEYDYE